MKTTDEIVADIAAAAPNSETPPEMLARIMKLVEGPHAGQVTDFKTSLLAIAAAWIEQGEAAGYDRETMFRVAANNLEASAAFLIRVLYRDLGQPFSPARFALVAYTLAEHSDKIVGADDMTRARAWVNEDIGGRA